MNYQKYKILKFIHKCPDIGIPKIVIHNALNMDNKELDIILKSLLEDELIFILNTKNKMDSPLYHINYKGYNYIKSYFKLKFKALWEKYLFSINLKLKNWL